MSVRTWCLAFQCLTQVSNTSCSDAVARWGPRAAQGMTHIISSDPQFVTVLLRFLSGSGLSSQNSDVSVLLSYLVFILKSSSNLF